MGKVPTVAVMRENAKGKKVPVTINLDEYDPTTDILEGDAEPVAPVVEGDAEPDKDEKKK